jgi:hypothetical protein
MPSSHPCDPVLLPGDRLALPGRVGLARGIRPVVDLLVVILGRPLWDMTLPGT